jgi:hypothetical protein
MEDGSPSITASDKGILTFTVAILASIYVRYSILLNGYTEMSTIYLSAECSSIEDKRIMQTTVDDTLGMLRREISRLETEIINEVGKAQRLPPFNSSPSRAVNVDEVLRTAGNLDASRPMAISRR